MKANSVSESINHRSEEVQEIITRVPGWMVRWGITLIFFLFTVVLFMCWFIKYPDIVRAQVIITTSPSPLTLVARHEGNMTLLIEENRYVKKGELIGFIQSNANIDDLFILDEVLNNNEGHELLPESYNLQLGELQVFLNLLTTSEQEIRSFYADDSHKKQIKQLNKQLNGHKQLASNSVAQLSLVKEEYRLAKEKLDADSLLFVQRVTAKLDYNAAKSTYLEQLSRYRTAEATIIYNQLQVNQLEMEIENIELERSEAEATLINNHQVRRRELSAQLKKWKEDYLFLSPADGEIAYLAFVENGQFIEAGKNLFSVIPASKRIYGQAELPISGSGKVKIDQQVNIRLNNYPFEQFGMLVGKVESISTVPSGDQYLIKISLPNGMTSSYNERLVFKQQLKGEVEVITEDLRLLERVFYQFRKLIRQS